MSGLSEELFQEGFKDGYEQAYKEAYKQGRQEVRAEFIPKILASGKFTLEEISNNLEISEAEIQDYMNNN
ncbi:MAG: hypothetical protein II948_02070 [Synergistaceae bacterium]|nr:hypothetical protein [Synergistaceae bacterium]MBQ9582482.1 hypothetical protein [Synergistaceae bacterium]MBR0044828.1 hypothetical protein [Synergistaceae bacterium]MBR0096576.1 hypothetical protein [Synergistaceae bacterium]MBR0221564.1 hypothetical protein [Synergistaceae bacterium]